MRIRIKLACMVAMACLAAGAIVAVLWTSDHEVQRLQDQQRRAEDLSSSASQLGTLTLQYLLDPNPTAAAQWRATATQAAADTRALSSDREAERVLHRSALAAVQQSTGLFARLIAATPGRPQPRGLLAQALQLHTQDIEAAATQLEQLHGQDTRHAIDAAYERVLILVGALLITQILFALWIGGTMYRALGALERGARAVGAGDLSYRIGLGRRDELGQVATAFDSMTASLQAASAALTQANADLERRVAARTAELEAANGELAAFDFSVAHDLRSPLRSIEGYSAILLEQNADELSGSTREMLAKIRDGVQRMSLLIDGLLRLGRAGRVELHEQEVELTGLVQRLVTELRWQEPTRRVDIDVRPLPTVNADPALIEHAFQNLLSNAVKFTSRCAIAKITVGVAEPSPPGEVTIFVQDNGAGFDPRYAGKLFGVFERLHPAHEFPGTGIGLAIVKRIVERHGGSVRGEGATGRGATFFVTLPASCAISTASGQAPVDRDVEPAERPGARSPDRPGWGRRPIGPGRPV